MNTRSLIVGAVVGAVVCGGVGYYAGTKHVSVGARQFTGAANFRGGAGGPGGIGAAGARTGGGFVSGEIIAQDATSMTIKEQNGSTKIVLLGSSAQITKSAPGVVSDLSNGTNVIVTGEQNTDGSMTAQSVQIRPAGLPAQAGMPMGGMPPQSGLPAQTGPTIRTAQ